MFKSGDLVVCLGASMIIKESALKKGLPKTTESLCPECKEVIQAKLYEENGKVMIEKKCKVHGKFKDIYWSDVKMYLRAEKHAYDGVGVSNPLIPNAKKCPNECGLCQLHLSHTVLANVDLTNRCNLNCPVCFANANQSGVVFEPTFEQVTEMLKTLRNNRPVPTPSVQFSGGEPTIHPDFFKIVRKAEELGFAQIQIASNGLKLGSDDGEFAQKCLDAGVDTVYLQFDGVTDDVYMKTRGRKLMDIKKKALENIRKTKPTKMSVCLVPTIVNGINDHQVGDILRFAIEYRDIVHAVNYQPVSFAGRISQEEREKQRFTLPDLAKRLKEQTNFIDESDMYPVPCVTPISEFASVFQNDPKVTFSAHPHCGLATFLFIEEDGNAIPITRFVKVDELFSDLYSGAKKMETSRIKSVSKAVEGAKLKLNVSKYIIKEKKPKSLGRLEDLIEAFWEGGDKKSLSEFTWSTMMVGGMHFQDDYNYDIERVKRCVIHYATPDGRIIPFCAYNGGPTYRDEVERKYSIPLKEYQEKQKKKEVAA